MNSVSSNYDFHICQICQMGIVDLARNSDGLEQVIQLGFRLGLFNNFLITELVVAFCAISFFCIAFKYPSVGIPATAEHLEQESAIRTVILGSCTIFRQSLLQLVDVLDSHDHADIRIFAAGLHMFAYRYQQKGLRF